MQQEVTESAYVEVEGTYLLVIDNEEINPVTFAELFIVLRSPDQSEREGTFYLFSEFVESVAVSYKDFFLVPPAIPVPIIGDGRLAVLDPNLLLATVAADFAESSDRRMFLVVKLIL